MQEGSSQGTSRGARRRSSWGRRHYGVAVTVLGGIALTCTACGTPLNGEQSKSAAQVWSDARAATTGAISFHFSGSITNQGQTVGLDLDMSRSGDGGGSLNLGGHTLDLVVKSGLVYVKGNAQAWASFSGGNTMAKFAGRWVMAPLSHSSISNLAEFTNSTEFLSNLKPKGDLKKQQAVAHWEGHPVVILSDATNAHIYVAATGKPYILHLSGGDSASHGTMEFDHYGTAHLPAAPSGAVNFLSGNASTS